MQCGLLGRHLGHSYSPQIHNRLAKYNYTLYEKEPEELENFLKCGDFCGLNVTIPYKKDVIPFCDILSDRAKKLGAVNTIVRRKDGTLVGHNTDYFGFLSMIERSGLSLSGKKVLVLGSGGASATATAVLDELGARPVVISRTGSDNYDNLSRHCDASAIVNATPVGMYPEVGISPVSLDPFVQLEGVLDLIYNPAKTALLIQAEERGIVAVNGLWMLVAQAKESAQWFTDCQISDKVILEIYNEMSRQMCNIILVGMPGSGKSTVGKLLAKKLNREFVDADSQIENAAGKAIPEIFQANGEEGFRMIETQVLSELGKQSGLVIATGGGCVTKKENYPLLHQNGIIFWLQRNLDSLPVNGRPLSQAGRLDAMYQIRKPLYQRFCDFTVDNNCPVADTVNSIVNLLKQEA